MGGSFRRKSGHGAQRAWDAWIVDHQDALHACGLPLEAFASRDKWLRFIDSYEVWMGSGFWYVERLTSPEMERLIVLLEQHPSPVPDQDRLLKILRVYLRSAEAN